MHAPLNVPLREACQFCSPPEIQLIVLITPSHIAISACLKEIQAINECHARGFLARLKGDCNAAREALNLCLRKEVRQLKHVVESHKLGEVHSLCTHRQRLDRTARNSENAKLRNEKKKQAWESLDKEV